MRQRTRRHRPWLDRRLCLNPRSLADEDRGYDPLTGGVDKAAVKALRVGVDYIGVRVGTRGGAR